MSEAPVPQAANTQPTPESERATNIAFLLDVDGVVTNPVEKKVTEPRIFDSMIANLTQGNPVALNTGRSTDWMIERVVKPLNERIVDKSLLKNFFAVGEKGLTWTSFAPDGRLIQGVFNKDGLPVEGYDLSVFLDPTTIEHFKTLSQEAKDLIARKYSHSTFFDASKKAMVSTEMHGTFDHARFEQEQGTFTEKLKAIVNKLGLQEQFTVDPTGIATDVQLKTVQEKDASGKVIAKNPVGKHLGARRILRWLELNKINPKLFISVGDSSSDLEMEDELTAQGKANEFYYVRPDKPLDDKTLKDTKGNVRKNIHTTKAKHSNGLLEVFDSVKKAA